MNSPFATIAAMLALAALACMAIGTAIARRAVRSAETTVLLLMIAVLTLDLGLLATDSWRMSGVHPDLRLHYIFFVSANMLRTVFFALGGHLLAFTYARLVPEGPAERHWRGFWIIIVLNYIAAIVTLTGQALSLMKHLAEPAGWPATGLDLEGFRAGFVLGCWAALWIAVELQVLVAVYGRIPGEGRPGSSFMRWYLNAAGDPPLTSLDLNPVRSSSNRLSLPWSGRVEAKAFLTLLVGVAAYGYVLLIADSRSSRAGSTYSPLLTLAIDLLPFFVLLPLVYYKMQFVFFDVLIKRGLLVTAVLASSCIFLFSQITVSSSLLCFAAAGFALFWALAYRRLDLAFDRYVFQRPDYGRLLVELGDESRRFIDSRPLLDHVCARLKNALDAEFVRFVANSDSIEDLSMDVRNSAASVAVGSGDQSRGWLLLGSRRRGQLFQSEDLYFLDEVAAQLSAACMQLEQQRRRRELRDLAVRAELKALQAQINPHFLFNALNTLADLIQTNPAEAETVALNLARIFHFTLEATSREQIPLGEEAAFVRSYLEIEHARFENKLRYRIDVPENLHSVPVPPMLIQPLVENAVKHGISPGTGEGCVTVRARQNGDWLGITVQDDGIGFSPAHSLAQKTGIGLANVRQRVEHLSGAGHWQIESAPGKGTMISFELSVSGRKDGHARIGG